MTASCRERLQKKIRANMHEYANPKQAIAVAYSQVLKASPRCKPHLRKSPMKKSKSPRRVQPSRVQKSKSVKKSIRKAVKKSVKKSTKRRRY